MTRRTHSPAGRRSRPRGLAPVAGALAAVVLVSGCASIPSGGGVGVIPLDDTDSAVQSQIDAEGPAEGDGPDEIVRGFLAAGSGYADDFEVARSFLTEDFSTEWNPFANVTVLTPGTNFDGMTAEVTTDQQTVSFSVPVQAVLDDRRIMREANPGAMSDLEFTLRQVNGEWRIAHAPQGIVLSSANFSTLFQAYPLFFYTPDYTALVPDTRWFVRSPATASEVMTEYLRGPADYLSGAVASAIPEGTQLDPRSVTVAEGQAQVGLSQQIEDLDPVTLERAIDQITATLGEVGAITSVQVSGPSGTLVPGANLDPTGVGMKDARPVALSENAIVRISGTTVEAVPGLDAPVEGASDPAVSDAQIHDFGSGTVYAYLSGDGRELRRQILGTQAQGGTGGAAVVAEGEDLVAPSVDRFGLVWTGERTSDGRIRTISAAGTETGLNAEFLDGRTVARLAVSRDGTRLAVLSTGEDDAPRIDVVGILRNVDGHPTGLASSAPLAVGTTFRSITDFSWAGPDQLVVLGAREAGGSPQPYVQHLPGLLDSLGSIDGSSSITAAEDLRSVRAGTESGDLFTYGGGSWQKVVGAAVFDVSYPG
ncbi:LpqB family beta-propeller domain-containing protein [Brevibacterium samyangense]|uniref:Sporulation and spore germination n=1 Tax=Brevibacterium samyangense TaxID=366888 RepID=A0ABP5EX39_9MICO